MSTHESFKPSGFPERDDTLPDKSYESTPFSPQHVARLLHESFRISQGVTTIQPFIMQYLADKNPGRFTDENLEAARETAGNSAIRFAFSPKVHDAETTAYDTIGNGQDPRDLVDVRHAEWVEIHQGLRPERRFDPLTEIMRSSIAMDYAWLAERGGRPRADEDQGKSQKSSKWLSQTFFYGLTRHPYGIPEYDQLFEDMTDAIPDHWDDPVVISYPDRLGGATEIPLSEALITVTNIHLTHYPNDWDLLPPDWRALFKLPETA